MIAEKYVLQTLKPENKCPMKLQDNKVNPVNTHTHATKCQRFDDLKRFTSR